MIKFFGEPLKEIKSKNSGKTLFCFDSNGAFITDDPVIIDRAMGFFDYVHVSPGEVGERVKKTVITPPIVITEKGQDEAEEQKEDSVEPKPEEVECKYCGGTHKNRQAVAACAKKHKKEGQ